VRKAFIDTINAIGSDPRIWFATADLGYSVIEYFRDTYPDQFVNVGIAEQNLVGVAAGLAHSGKVVFTYSIANFPTLRCLEQIRNDVCYHNLPVKIVAVGGGCAYGALGYTHHGTEDIGIMRALPQMVVVAPGDPIEAAAATRALAALPGPAYLRLGKAGEANVHTSDTSFEIGKAITVTSGDDITFIATGGMLCHAVKVARQLEEEHRLKLTVLSMHTIKPIDVEAIVRAAKTTGGIVTVEDHSVNTGLGAAVADVLATEQLAGVPFAKFGMTDSMCHLVGSQEYLYQQMGDLGATAVRLLRLTSA